MALAVFLAYLVGLLVRLELAREAWWAVAVLLGLAAMSLSAGIQLLMLHKALTIEIGSQGLTTGGSLVDREDVKVVRCYTTLLFKGVRVELRSGSVVDLPAHVHRPGRLLKAFRRYGYPVEEPRVKS